MEKIKEFLTKLDMWLKDADSIISQVINMARSYKSVVMVIALFISLIVNMMSIPQIQGTINSISTAMNSSLESGIEWLKSMSSDYSGLLGFLGSFLGGCMAIIVYKLQINHNRKQEIKRLMFLLLSTYRTMRTFEDTGFMDKLRNDKELLELSEKKYSGFVHDQEWRKLIVHIKNFKEVEFITRWFYNIENCIIPTKDSIEGRFRKIEKILKKYKFEKYLEEVEFEITKAKEEELSKGLKRSLAN